MKQDSLGDRMKGYEAVFNQRLVTRMPVIMRLDGCHFHTFTKGMKRPFDDLLISCMQKTMLELCKSIQGVVMGYAQSDEITLVLVDYETIKTGRWFEYKTEKMCSVAASMATNIFNRTFIETVESQKNTLKEYDSLKKKYFQAQFDCRVFNVPKEDVCNCVLWRQKDAERNSIQMVAQSLFSHKELMGLSCDKLQDKMFKEKGINWNDFPTYQKRGSACIKDEDGKWFVDLDMPILSSQRDYVEKRIFIGE